MVPSGLVIHAEEHHALDPFAIQIIGKAGTPLLVGESHDEQILIAFLAGELRWTGIRADHEDIILQQRINGSQHRIRYNQAGDDLNLLSFHQLVRGIGRFHGAGLVVYFDQFDRTAAELVAEMFEREVEAAFLLGAEHAESAAHR